MRRDVAAAIIRIGGGQIRQRLVAVTLPEQHPAQTIENRGILRRRRVGALDQRARVRELLFVIRERIAVGVQRGRIVGARLRAPP